MKPEAQVELILWDWLKVNGTFIEEIFFNRKNELDCATFQTKGLNKKPDFVVKINRGYGVQHVAIEIKNATSSKSVLDAGKILDYYENYFLGKTQYFIGVKEIKIDHFVIATQNSKVGCLFNEEKSVIFNTGSNDAWRVTNAKYSLEPEYEFEETSRFQRNLWNQFKRLRDNNLHESLAHKVISPHGFVLTVLNPCSL